MRTKLTLFLAGALLFAVSPASAQTPVPVGFEFQVNTYTTNRQLDAAVEVAPDGDVVVVWQSSGSPGDDTSLWSVQGQRFAADASPIGSQFQINTYTSGGQGSPALALAPAGDFVVVWESSGSPGDDTSADSIQGQRLAADGSFVGSQFQVNAYTSSFQQSPAVEVAPAGDFVVVWNSYGSPDGDPYYASIQGQRFARDASPIGSEFQVNTYTENYQQAPSVALDPAGDFVVVWRSLGSDNGDPSSWSVQGQRFQVPIFADGFESGDTTAWSETVGKGL